MEEQREARWLIIEVREQHLRLGTLAKQRLLEVGFRGNDLLRQPLVFGEFLDELEDQPLVTGLRGTNPEAVPGATR